MDKLEEKAIERVGELLKDDIFECVVVSDAERCYIEGYKDAQKEMLDKACNWLSLNLQMLLNVFDVEYNTNDTKTEDFIDDFKKAMEDVK